MHFLNIFLVILLTFFFCHKTLFMRFIIGFKQIIVFLMYYQAISNKWFKNYRHLYFGERHCFLNTVTPRLDQKLQ